MRHRECVRAQQVTENPPHSGWLGQPMESPSWARRDSGKGKHDVFRDKSDHPTLEN